MGRFILDTNIILHYVRQSKLAQKVENDLNLLAQDAIPIVTSVSVGEMEAFVQRQEWGQNKIDRLKKLAKKIVVIDIASADNQLMNAYATLWNYSKNALPGNKLGKSIGIGQNDVWIAAVAYTTKATLVTTDSDFDHLNGEWITVHKFKPK